MRLRIDKAVYGGAGLARVPESDGTDAAGKTVFVPMALPGELVEVHIAEDRGSFLNAEVDLLLEPSASRATPACPYFGGCGGCHYQHGDYSAQVQMKVAILAETLERAGVFKSGTAAFETLTGEPWGYRNRIRLHVGAASDDEPPALCYRQRGSHAMLRVDECPIAAPILVEVLRATQRLLAAGAVDVFWNDIEMFCSAQQDAVLVSLSISGADGSERLAALQEFCELLRQEVPQIRGGALFPTDGDPHVAKKGGGPGPRKMLAEWGEPGLNYRSAGFEYRVSVGSFFQVNRFLVDGLVELVTAGSSGELAWDLYAGVGLFGRALTRSFGMVRAVEPAPSSCADLRVNLQGTRHKVVESTTLDFLRLQASGEKSPKKAEKPDLIVVDPPRAGLGSEVTSLLARIAAREIVYVSCDPATLARDLRALLQSGYQLQKITMVDLFPQTFHLESVSRLSLR